MTAPVAEWLEGQADRTNARQRAQVDTGKLIATFSAGIVATIVATTLQVGRISTWDRIAAALLALAFLGGLLAIFLDRLTEANQGVILAQSIAQGWSDSRLLQELRSALLATTSVNERVVRSVQIAVAIQVTISLFAAAAAIISVLFSK